MVARFIAVIIKKHLAEKVIIECYMAKLNGLAPIYFRNQAAYLLKILYFRYTSKVQVTLIIARLLIEYLICNCGVKFD